MTALSWCWAGQTTCSYNFQWLDHSCLQTRIKDQFDVAPICQGGALADTSITTKSEATSERLNAKCLPGWAEFADNCYLPKTEKRSWSEAEADCMIYKGGHLASILSEAEYSFVAKFLTVDFWIGGRTEDDKYDGSSWKWSDSSVFNFAKWSYRPVAYPDQLCLISTLGYDWTGTGCRSRNPYICKIK